MGPRSTKSPPCVTSVSLSFFVLSQTTKRFSGRERRCREKMGQRLRASILSLSSAEKLVRTFSVVAGDPIGRKSVVKAEFFFGPATPLIPKRKVPVALARIFSRIDIQMKVTSRGLSLFLCKNWPSLYDFMFFFFFFFNRSWSWKLGARHTKCGASLPSSPRWRCTSSTSQILGISFRAKSPSSAKLDPTCTSKNLFVSFSGKYLEFSWSNLRLYDKINNKQLDDGEFHPLVQQ